MKTELATKDKLMDVLLPLLSNPSFSGDALVLVRSFSDSLCRNYFIKSFPDFVPNPLTRYLTFSAVG